jgi:hypothetical protein
VRLLIAARLYNVGAIDGTHVMNISPSLTPSVFGDDSFGASAHRRPSRPAEQSNVQRLDRGWRTWPRLIALAAMCEIATSRDSRTTFTARCG